MHSDRLLAITQLTKKSGCFFLQVITIGSNHLLKSHSLLTINWQSHCGLQGVLISEAVGRLFLETR